jgi:HYR domain
MSHPSNHQMRRGLQSLALAMIVGIASAQAVAADSLTADGDGLTPLANARVDFGTICLGEPVTATALVAVRATGHPNNANVFEDGTTVTMVATILSGTGLDVTSADPSTAMAGDWRSQGNGSFAAPVAWDVTLTPAALGTYSGRIHFEADGVNRHGNAINRTTNMNVHARVVDCAAPVFSGVPADLVIEATGPGGAVAAYAAPTASDAVDGPRQVTCDTPSGSLFSLGPSLVTCTASDRAGNAGSATFSVTVVDTTPPDLSGLPADQALDAADSAGATASWSMPTATDTVDGDVPVTCDPPSGSLFAPGSQVVTCRASDQAGNEAVASFSVEVTAPAPPEPPAEPDAVDQGNQDTQDTPADQPAQADQGAQAVSDSTGTPGTGSLPNTAMRDSGSPAATLGILLLVLAALAATRRLSPQEVRSDRS